MPYKQPQMPGEGLPQSLYDAVSYLERRVAVHLRGTGLHWGLRRLLQHLFIEDGLSQSELAEAVRYSEASVSNMLKHLLKGEWVERRQDEYDYRVSRIYLADRGRELREAIQETLRKADEQIREALGAEDADRLLETLGRAVISLDAHAADCDPEGKETSCVRPGPPGEL